jgi:hypothetical protein
VRAEFQGKRIKDMPEYTVYCGIIARCRTGHGDSAARYKGAGVALSREWQGRGGFKRFYLHIGPKPSPEHQIDRIDGARGYEPGNVRWATRHEQSRNRRSNINVTIGGETMCVFDWCKRTGIPAPNAYARIAIGWEPARAVVTPVAKTTKRQKEKRA